MADVVDRNRNDFNPSCLPVHIF